MSWELMKHAMSELEEVLVKLGILLSAGFFIFDMLRRKLSDLRKHGPKK